MSRSHTRSSAMALLLVAAWILTPPAAAQGSGFRVVVPDDVDGAYLGVRLTEEIEHPDGGARVTGVVDDSPAAEAGIREDDIIVEFDGNTIRGPVALTKKIRACEAGHEVTIKVIRDGKAQEVGAVLGRRSPELVYAPQWDPEGE